MYPLGSFTEDAEQALTLAQEEAQRSRRNYIAAEHLLLGLMRGGGSVAAVVLSNLDVEVTQVRTTLDAILGPRDRVGIQQIIPTSRVKKIIDLSFKEARRMGDNHVGTEHLLLGLHVEGENIASHVLQDLGANQSRVSAEIGRLRAEDASPGEPARDI